MKLARRPLSRARMHGVRGAGLGNEVIPWCKAYIGSRVLGATLVEPAWSLSARRYGAMLGSSGLDWVPHITAPLGRTTVVVSQQAYERTGLIDYGDALLAMAQEDDRLSAPDSLIDHEGMWGGYAAIRRARPFLRQRLLSAPGVVDDLSLMEARLNSPSNGVGRAVVGIHVRGGDFAVTERLTPGRFNESTPIGWYDGLVDQIKAACPGDVRFVLCSDSPDDARVRELGRRCDAEPLPLRNPVVSELLLLSMADLVLCSVSSFSMTAVFLGQNAYIWPAEHLTVEDGLGTLWGRQHGRRLHADGVADVSKSHAVPQGGALPSAVVEGLLRAAGERDDRGNLLYFGSVPCE
jgi:hypothetical protein